MIRIFEALKYASLFTLASFTFVACDKEFNSIDSDVLGEGNFNFNTDSITMPIAAYNRKLGALQSNNLSSYLLGFYSDNFGSTAASVVTQVQANTYPANFGYNPILKSVILNIPYFSTATTVNSDGYSTYELDSLYGSAPIKLSIYKNNYFLGGFDPESSSEGAKAFYTNDESTFYSGSNSDNLGELIYQNDNFTFSNEEIVLLDQDENGETQETLLSPRLRVDILETNKTFWEDTFFANKDNIVLSNDNQFKTFFRGFYIKAEALTEAGSLVVLNINDASITLNYSKQNVTEYGDMDNDGIPDFADADPDGNEETSNATDTDKDGINDATDVDQVEGGLGIDFNLDGIDDNYGIIDGAYTLNFTQNSVNLLQNDFPIIENLTPNTSDGDEKLFLKGAAGSIGVIDLFNGLVICEENNNEETALDCFKKTYRQLYENGYVLKKGEEIEEINGTQYITKNGDFVLKRLINEAQLIIHEDIDIENPEDHASDRIYAYDIKNNIPTVDYYNDATDNTSTPLYSKIISLGERKTINGVSKYKIRITEHLKNILVNDSTNTKLGLVLSNNVNNINNSMLLENEGDDINQVPSTSIITPRGTIIYGSSTNVDKNNRMKLKIFFTEPEK